MSTALVTGGGGFIGGAVLRLGLARGHAMRSIARGDYPALRALGVTTYRGDIAEAGALDEAVRDCDLVFHVAAHAGVWGDEAEFQRANVEATQQVIDACRRHGVPRLIFTSSPSVTFSGDDQDGVDESTAVPRPEEFLAAYPRTKAEAERRVLAAHGPDLGTVALRPHLVWGPGDHHLVPRLVARARAGTLRLVDDPRAAEGHPRRVDFTYIDNAAEAHWCAAAAFPRCGGKAYFITNGEPLPLNEFVNRVLAAAGLPPCTRRISPWLATTAGAVLETVYGWLHLRAEPKLTRFVARQLATAHWFNIDAARRDLGYSPRVTIEEGLRRLAAEFAAEAGRA